MTVSKLQPKEHPSNLDLQSQIGELHDCLEKTNVLVTEDRHVAKARDTALDRKMKLIEDRVGKVEADTTAIRSTVDATRGAVELLVTVLGVRGKSDAPHGLRKPLAGLERWQAFAGVGGLIIATMGAYHAIDAWGLAGLVGLASFYHALMGH